MAFRFWLFVGALIGLTSVLAAAYGAHALNRYALIPTVAKIHDIAQLQHALHALALFGVAILLAATEGRRRIWASLMLNLAALGFLFGVLLFSGGIYYEVLMEAKPPKNTVPTGGVCLMIGWVALALSVFGFRLARGPGASA